MISVEVVSKGWMVTAGKGLCGHKSSSYYIGIVGEEGKGIRDVRKQQEVGITTETAKTRGNR